MENQTRPAPSLNEQKQVTLQVTQQLAVTVLPNSEHEFLMTTKEVAKGYGVSQYAIRQSFFRNSTEIKEGKHFVKGITICNTLPNSQPHQVFWTKRGIVRLGFFVKSLQAKLFRDWAEELIIERIEQNQMLPLKPKEVKALTGGNRKHNRLTPDRLLNIMAEVVKIDDATLRQSIANQLLNL